MTFKADVLTSSELPPEALEMLRLMIGQIPLAIALRDGEFRIKSADIDKCGGWKLTMNIDHGAKGGPEFVFTAEPFQHS